MKYIAIHIDDELDSRNSLKKMVEEICPNVHLADSAASVVEGVELIKTHRPHIVFLDIEMPTKKGFELFELLDTIRFHTIVVTGYDEYALDAIHYAALDYLLKPLNAHELKLAVEKVDSIRTMRDPRLLHLAELVKQNSTIFNNLVISSETGFKIIDINNINYIESQSGNYCIFYVNNGRSEIVTKALTHFQRLLPTNLFFRLNRSQMVHHKAVKGYSHKTGGVVLNDGKVLTVVLRKRAEFKRFIQS